MPILLPIATRAREKETKSGRESRVERRWQNRGGSTSVVYCS